MPISLTQKYIPANCFIDYDTFSKSESQKIEVSGTFVSSAQEKFQNFDIVYFQKNTDALVSLEWLTSTGEQNGTNIQIYLNSNNWMGKNLGTSLIGSTLNTTYESNTGGFKILYHNNVWLQLSLAQPQKTTNQKYYSIQAYLKAFSIDKTGSYFQFSGSIKFNFQRNYSGSGYVPLYISNMSQYKSHRYADAAFYPETNDGLMVVFAQWSDTIVDYSYQSFNLNPTSRNLDPIGEETHIENANTTNTNFFENRCVSLVPVTSDSMLMITSAGSSFTIIPFYKNEAGESIKSDNTLSISNFSNIMSNQFTVKGCYHSCGLPLTDGYAVIFLNVLTEPLASSHSTQYYTYLVKVIVKVNNGGTSDINVEQVSMSRIDYQLSSISLNKPHIYGPPIVCGFTTKDDVNKDYHILISTLAQEDNLTPSGANIKLIGVHVYGNNFSSTQTKTYSTISGRFLGLIGPLIRGNDNILNTMGDLKYDELQKYIYSIVADNIALKSYLGLKTNKSQYGNFIEQATSENIIGLTIEENYSKETVSVLVGGTEDITIDI